ncbi:hypothetical protein ACFYW1_31980 [Streptomyces sp. NPDC002669]|uniref:hypothetical protein n=1 Tax=Streptomyces sp. NPDC002669 TaxID=3364658 RepID=UPI00367C504F
MGVNVMFDFAVHGLADEAETRTVLDSIADLVTEEGFQDHEVAMGWSVIDGQYFITGETDYPVGIRSFYAMRPRFETGFRERVHALAPAATHSINWNCLDGG